MRVCMIVMLLAALGAAATAQDMPPWIRGDMAPPPTPEQVGQTWIEIDGEIYGAVPGDLGPIGGGEGYRRIITEGDYTVSTVEQLLESLAAAQPGQVVYVEPGFYDVTTLVYAEEDFVLAIPEGVTLASNRGHDGSRGAVIHSGHFGSRLVTVTGPNVRITGIWLMGPDAGWRIDHHRRSFSAEARERHAKTWPDARSPGHQYYYRLPTSRAIRTTSDALEVDNCEISGWTAAVSLGNGIGHHVHHCYIHHCQRHGLGYGVAHDPPYDGSGRAESITEYNLFNYNRHSLKSSGAPGAGYEARHNVELGVSRSAPVDMHGGRDRRDDTDIAGDWMKVHHNTYRCPPRAIGIRGVPREQAEIYNNWFYQSEPGPGTIGPWPPTEENRLDVGKNAYGLDEPTVH
jgi:hypothetical protein